MGNEAANTFTELIHEKHDSLKANLQKLIYQLVSENKESKLKHTRILLNDHLVYLDISKLWIAPLCVFISTLITVLTTSIKDRFYLKAPVWEAVFILVCITSLIITLIKGFNAFSNINNCSIDSLVKKIKNEQYEKDN